MRDFILKASVVLTFAFILHVQLEAQDVASITGVVTDQTGAVIPGVTVTLQNPQTAAIYPTVTNAVGSYTLNEVKPGPGYKITFSLAGFNPVVISGLYLNVDATRTQNARMKVGASETVEVSAANDNVTLDTTDATVGNNFEGQFLNDLPIENRSSPSALFTQQPGVTLDGAVTGARVDQDNVTLDGLDVNDNTTGIFGAVVGNAPVDSVQEFRGVTAGELSSAGEGGGGQFELVTRGGTGQFHGAVVEYHRDTDLEANDWFNNNTGTPRPPLIRNQFGGDVGGPVLKNRLFLFFDYNARRDTLSNLVERIVPTPAYRGGNVGYYTNFEAAPPTSSSLNPAELKALDPLHIGFNASLLSLLNSRYPPGYDSSAGDGLNTIGLRFNAPFPFVENDYVQRVDYNLNSTMKVFGVGHFTRTTGTENPIQFPGDPPTFPFLDQSYSWVAGHTWTISNNMVNQAEYGETFTSYNFPDSYNETGVTQYAVNSFGGTGTGASILSAPYANATNTQGRSFPVPVVKDDLSWLKGKHVLTFGGTFKWETPNGYTIFDYNEPFLGLGGNMESLSEPGSGPNTLRPSDLDSNPEPTALYDSAFTLALGRFASSQATFNYNAQGAPIPQGAGSTAIYRYYETELYFGDAWKLTPDLTISYGLRWQNYTVPYETQGTESLPNMDFNQYFGARLAQSAAGVGGPSTNCNSQIGAGVPCVAYVLGGKANNAPGYFNPVNKNFAPRVAFAYNPSFDRKSVFSGGAGIVYDHSVVNGILYQASQYSYLFQAGGSTQYGVTGDPVTSLTNDPRFSGLTSPPTPPSAPSALTPPYMPYVVGSGASAFPYGLAYNQPPNEGIDRNLKTPYSIEYNFGFQHEFPQGYLMKMTYVGRLGRRLIAQADAEQLIDFPDKASGQLMSQAMAGITTQLRAGVSATDLATEPWFEDVLPAGIGQAYHLTNTQYVAAILGPLPYRGDFADTIQALAAYGLLPANVGMGAQFSEDTYYTNKGFSSYNGMLVTLHKNAGYGLQFDLNYTWSHSIDNVSLPATSVAFGGYGFICDVVRPRECRGNSDFDVTNYLNGNFIYELPFGHGKSFGATMPFWANEIIGGWAVSGLPIWHSGNAYFAQANAYLASFSNDAPAILTGPISLLKAHVTGGAGQSLNLYANPTAAVNAFTGPVGFQIGTRNNLRGPGYFNLDLGVGKTFPVYREKVNLKFRVDAFNAFNHPNFNLPEAAQSFGSQVGTDITEASGVPFGTLSSTVVPPSSDQAARVLQGSLRLEF